jgi:multimeric flavodoxin WrbA
MKISLINGSQKIGVSNTGIILDWFHGLIKERHEVKLYNCGVKYFTNETFREIISGDVIVLAFPLFVDSIPSNTLKMLIELEKTIKQEQAVNLIIYTIVNNGFYEGKQNHVSFEIIKNWCEHSGVKFGGGIGQGAGEMMGQLTDTPLNKGPFNNLAKTLQAMVKTMELRQPFETRYLSPYFPRFLWRFMGTRHWNTLAQKNGIKKKEITKRL